MEYISVVTLPTVQLNINSPSEQLKDAVLELLNIKVFRSSISLLFTRLHIWLLDTLQSMVLLG